MAGRAAGPPGPDRVRSGSARRRRRAGRALAVVVALVGVAAVAGGGGRDETRGAAAPAAPEAATGTGADRQTEAPSPAVPTTSASSADPLAGPVRTTRAPDPLVAAAARARRITDRTADWASFTLLDRVAGRSAGDARSAEVTFVESVVKAWLAADLLATSERERRPLTAYERGRMTTMIRDSDDDDAEVIWRWLGGDASIKRMIEVCGMTDTSVYPGRWSLTRISARDLARLGSCLVPRGRVLSAKAGAELLRLMRTVSPSNAFGIPQAQPAGAGVPVAVKNGWTEHGGVRWNVNCLALWGSGLRWVLAVTVRYPIANGLGYGAGVCRRVTDALFP